MLRKYLAVVTCLTCVTALAFGGVAGAAEPTESYGNNLSWPVVFAEGHGVTGYPVSTDNGLRGDPAAPSLVESYTYNDVDYYLQRTVNTWQAGSESGKAAPWSGTVDVTVDWSDNLKARSWRTDSVIRIENVLHTVSSAQATAFNMAYLYGEGIGEVWGTDGTTFQTTERYVYTFCARLCIQRLDGRDGNPIGDVIYDSAAYERFGVDGPTDAYSAEINVPGKLIYGSMWHLDDLEMADIGLDDYPKEGWYRITFMLDPTATYDIAGEEGSLYSVVDEPCNVSLAEIDASDVSIVGSQSGPLLRIADDGTWTSMDIQVVKSPGGGGGGGKGPGGGGGHRR